MSKKSFVLLILFVVSCLVLSGCNMKPKEKVKVEVFAVSACPFIMDMEYAAEPFLKEMGDYVDFNMYYYGNERSPGNFSSFHGDQEPFLNIVELCIIEHNRKDYSYMPVINCLNHRVDYQKPDETIQVLLARWEECTDNTTRGNNDKVKECIAGDEGIELYRQSIDYIKTVKDAKFPPLLLVNGRKIPAFDDLAFKIEVCKYLDSELCTDLPMCNSDGNCPDVEGKLSLCVDHKCELSDAIKVIVLKDPSNNKPEYFNADIIEWFSLYLGKMEIEYVDPDSVYGKVLAEQFELKEFPAILFDDKIEKTYGWNKEADILPFILREKKSGKFVYRKDQYLRAQDIFNGVRETPLNGK